MTALLELQQLMMNHANDVETDAKDAATCVRAWVEAEKLRMVKLGKPIQVMPAQIQISKARKFGLLRSVDAQIVDIAPAEKPPEPVALPLQSTTDNEKPQ